MSSTFSSQIVDKNPGKKSIRIANELICNARDASHTVVQVFYSTIHIKMSS